MDKTQALLKQQCSPVFLLGLQRLLDVQEKSKAWASKSWRCF